MAIAGIVVSAARGHGPAVRRRLLDERNITDVQETRDPCRLAAVLEAPARLMEEATARLLAWDGVLTVDLAMISYEDELTEGKELECPPHRPRRHGQGGVPPA